MASNTAPQSVLVFDTNVLLTDPQSIFAFPDSEIVIPETVLSELDKLKTSHADQDLRFRGREVSRLIFEVAEGNSLVEGVELPDGGTLRIIPFEYNQALPDGFSTKTPDDKILATAYLVKRDLGKKAEVTLMTNDLNMLLKAQTLGIEVQQFGKGDDVSFGKRYIIRPFQRYRTPLTILMLAVALFAAVIVIVGASGGFSNDRQTALSTEFRDLLTSDQKTAYDALIKLQDNPKDTDAMLSLADFYYNRTMIDQSNGDQTALIADAKNGITYFTSYLANFSTNADARSDMAALYYYSGDTDTAIKEIGQVLELYPNHVNANYNLGIFYLFGRGDLTAAKNQMQTVIDMTKGSTANKDINEQATQMLQQIESRQSAESSGTATS